MTRQEVAEDWDGHNFQDNCPWQRESFLDHIKAPLAFPRLLWEMYAYFGRDRKYFDQLRSFLAAKPATPIKTLTDGQLFDVAKYTRGTIIRISKATTMRPPSLEHYDMWGYIEQGREPEGGWGDEIVAFPVHHFRLGREGNPPLGYIGYRNWHKTFTVGEVIHDRWSGIQTLTRYGNVEIWVFGKALRESVPQPQAQTNLVLKPQNTPNKI